MGSISSRVLAGLSGSPYTIQQPGPAELLQGKLMDEMCAGPSVPSSYRALLTIY